MRSEKTSRISGFYRLPIEERRRLLARWLDPGALDDLTGVRPLPEETADLLIENVVGTFSLPIGLGLNFNVNGRDVIVPMVIEEPSVVAGASFMARLARAGGGLTAEAGPPEMVGQIQVLDIPPDELETAANRVHEAKEDLLESLYDVDPVIQELGGGARDLEVRILLDTPIGPFLVLHLIFDVRDAMGANTVNTACERLTPEIEALTGGRVHLRILTNLADRRLARAGCRVPAAELAFGDFSGEEVVTGIIEAWAFAAADPYRAATHNKGIMNGIDPILIATGNDWRAVEAGAHAYAARDGRYTSLTTWSKNDEGDLVGEIELPMAVGIVGGMTTAHPGAQAALELMGIDSAAELAEIIAAVGLVQNLAALRALATEGIQKGHMRLHKRKVES